MSVVTDLILQSSAMHWLAMRRQVISTFKSHGATSSQTARPAAELRTVSDDVWEQFLREGLIREGAPGQFYLFEPRRAKPRERLMKMVVFYGLIVLIPIILVLMSRH